MGSINEESLKEANEVFEAKFAWLVYMMAVFIGNRPVSKSNHVYPATLTRSFLSLIWVRMKVTKQMVNSSPK